MNVFMVTRAISPFMDEGSKNFAFNLCTQIKDHKFHLMTSKDADLPLIDNITYHRIYPKSHVLNVSRIGIINKARLFYEMILNHKGIDVYHFIFTPEVISSRLANLFLKHFKKKSIQTIPTPITKAKLKKCLFADKIVVLSEWTKRRVLDLGYDNVVKINPGIDLDRFSKKKIKDIREKLNIPKDEFVIFFPNEYDIKRGTRVVLSILKKLTNDFPKVKIIFAGRLRHDEDKKEKKFLVESVNNLNLNNRVIFLDRISYMPDLINSSDIVIFPMLSPLLKMEIPMTILESLALEKPVIISDIPPLNELLSKNKVGFIIKPDDSKALLESVIKFIKNKKLKTEMGKTGRLLIKKEFNIKKIAEEYAKLYEELG